jgi:hypothetical protein
MAYRSGEQSRYGLRSLLIAVRSQSRTCKIQHSDGDECGRSVHGITWLRFC